MLRRLDIQTINHKNNPQKSIRETSRDNVPHKVNKRRANEYQPDSKKQIDGQPDGFLDRPEPPGRFVARWAGKKATHLIDLQRKKRVTRAKPRIQ